MRDSGMNDPLLVGVVPYGKASVPAVLHARIGVVDDVGLGQQAICSVGKSGRNRQIHHLSSGNLMYWAAPERSLVAGVLRLIPDVRTGGKPPLGALAQDSRDAIRQLVPHRHAVWESPTLDLACRIAVHDDTLRVKLISRRKHLANDKHRD